MDFLQLVLGTLPLCFLVDSLSNFQSLASNLQSPSDLLKLLMFSEPNWPWRGSSWRRWARGTRTRLVIFNLRGRTMGWRGGDRRTPLRSRVITCRWRWGGRRWPELVCYVRLATWHGNNILIGTHHARWLGCW